MRLTHLVLAGSLPALLLAQSTRLDHGRMDPAWFGPGLTFERTTRVAFLWVRPGVSLVGKTLHARAWEPPVWIVKPRSEEDKAFLRRLDPILLSTLVQGVRAEIGDALPVSMEAGDMILTGRVTDCLAGGVGGMFGGLAGVYFDLKVTDAASGELLLGAHHFIEGATAESIQTRYTAWVRTFARVVAERTLPPQQPAPLKPLQPLPGGTATPVVVPHKPTGELDASAADLEAALRRLAALRRDGLINEDEFQTLRKQAIEKAKASGK